MKTAISVPDDLFRQVDKFAEEHHYSRSEVFVTAVKEFMERLKSQQLLQDLNAAHIDLETAEDKELRKVALKHYAKNVLREKY